MKTFIKWLGILLVLPLFVGAALFAQVWYFKPVSINLFFEKVFIKFALEDPELLSNLGLVEQFGINGHNARLSDVSPARQQAQLEQAREDLDTLRRYDRAGLDAQQKLSYDVLEWFLQNNVDGERWQWHNYPVNQLFGVQSSTPDFMVQIHRLNTAEDAEFYVSRLAAFGPKFSQVLEGVKLREQKGIVPPRFVIEKVLAEMRGFTGVPAAEHVLYKNFKEKLEKLAALPESRRAELLEQARQQIEQTVYPAYQGLIAYFETLLPKVTENHGVWNLPDGDAYYDYEVASNTTTKLTAEEVHQIGLGEVNRIESEMDAILKAQGLTEGTIGARVTQLNADPRYLYPNDDAGREQALKEYQRLIDEISAGLDTSFNARPKMGVKVERIPVFKEKTAPGAYYNPPALDGTRPGIFFANLRDMNEIQKFGMRTLSYHEAVPGHHFQIAIAQELKGLPTFRTILPFTAYVEGWALYSEQLAWELGFENDPLDNLGRLQAEMFRAVRLVVDTGMHRKRWTREQAITYMQDKTGMTEGEVVSEIERYLVNPGQALAYKTGMLKILELRARAQDQLGAKFDLKQFHDVVLTNGALPLGILERVVDEWIAATR